MNIILFINLFVTLFLSAYYISSFLSSLAHGLLVLLLPPSFSLVLVRCSFAFLLCLCSFFFLFSSSSFFISSLFIQVRSVAFELRRTTYEVSKSHDRMTRYSAQRSPKCCHQCTNSLYNRMRQDVVVTLSVTSTTYYVVQILGVVSHFQLNYAFHGNVV